MPQVKFTDEHEWIRVEDDGEATVGITDYAQRQLGDMVFVELPEPGRTVTKGAEVAVVESVKAASEVYAPASGTVTAVNTELTAKPALVNEEPMGQGWLLKMRLSDPAELDGLLDQTAYDAYVNGLV